jgi:ABC-type Na+ efflux pump permease subunit
VKGGQFVKDILAILRKEWRNFAGSEKGVFVVFGILVLSWSFLSRNNAAGASDIFNSVWWLFFSVVVCSNFANTVFVTERVSGSMEILLTSGFSRNAVLFGKVLFVIIVSAGIGAACIVLSLLWIYIFDRMAAVLMQQIAHGALLYACGVFMNAAAGAWMSIRFSSFRIIPFVNIFVLSLICAVYYALPSGAILMLILAAVGVLFLVLAAKDFNGEKIIAPVDL